MGTLKYLQYEFFAAAAHAFSNALPSEMSFLSMPTMDPDCLRRQVKHELEDVEEDFGAAANIGFSARLLGRLARDDVNGTVVEVPVDVLSFSSLLTQGFEEGP